MIRLLIDVKSVMQDTSRKRILRSMIVCDCEQGHKHDIECKMCTAVVLSALIGTPDVRMGE
jgi:hypothetical protein